MPRDVVIAGGHGQVAMVSSMSADPQAEPEGFGAHLGAKGEAAAL